MLALVRSLQQQGIRVPPPHSEFQSFRISSDEFAERDRVEAFLEVLGRTILKVETTPLGDQPLYIGMTMRGSENLGIAVGTASAMRNRHLAPQSDNDDLVLVVVHEGVGVAEQCGRETRVANGQAILTANGEEGCFTGHCETRL